MFLILFSAAKKAENEIKRNEIRGEKLQWTQIYERNEKSVLYLRVFCNKSFSYTIFIFFCFLSFYIDIILFHEQKHKFKCIFYIFFFSPLKKFFSFFISFSVFFWEICVLSLSSRFIFKKINKISQMNYDLIRQ